MDHYLDSRLWEEKHLDNFIFSSLICAGFISYIFLNGDNVRSKIEDRKAAKIVNLSVPIKRNSTEVSEYLFFTNNSGKLTKIKEVGKYTNIEKNESSYSNYYYPANNNFKDLTDKYFNQ